MMRRVRLSLLLLLIGAVVNVLVAWGCARWGQSIVELGASPIVGVSRVPEEARERLAERQETREPRPSQIPEFEVYTRTSTACTTTHYRRWHPRSFGGTYFTHMSHGFGLPLRSAGFAEQCYVDMISYPGFGQWRLPGWRGGWPIAPSAEEQDVFGGTYLQPEHVYPLVPMPIGFVFNTGFYALIAWGAVATLARARRRRRARRGLCVGCGYDVAGLAACPECGRAKV